jgi:hypothetical protein
VALLLEPLADAQFVLGRAEKVGLLFGMLAALDRVRLAFRSLGSFAYIVETEQNFPLIQISLSSNDTSCIGNRLRIKFSGYGYHIRLLV